MSLLTEISYLYRDASNYKFRGAFCLLGEFRLEELGDCLIDGEFFIPEKIGLIALRPEPTNEDDHLFHSIEDCRIIAGEDFQMTAGEFKRRVEEASRNGWFS